MKKRSLILWLLVWGGVAMGQVPVWKWQNPLPTSSSLQDVHFINAQTGYAAGSAGTILKTLNGGHSWIPMLSGTRRQLSDIHFVDPQTGWAVGDSGTVLATDNGGDTWTMKPTGTIKNLYSVFFVDSQNGTAVGQVGTILTTTNGGNTWSLQTSSINQDMNAVYRINLLTGWIAGSQGKILKTTDGGVTWNVLTTGSTPALHSIHFIDAQTGWVCGSSGKVFKTVNGGSSWVSQTASPDLELLYSVHFIDAQNGWVVGNTGIMLHTTNGGSTWTQQNIAFYNQWPFNVLFSVSFVTDKIGWAVGAYGAILKTIDGGVHWDQQRDGTIRTFRSVHFADDQTGFAVGDTGTVYKTRNSGFTWLMQESGTRKKLNAVRLVDPQTGWVAGDSGLIMKTVDGGSTWNVQPTGVPYNLKSLFFTNPQTGWAVGDSGTILQTSNGGSTWTKAQTGTKRNLTSVHFSGPLRGWAVGNAGYLIQTFNGGVSWSGQSIGGVDLNGVFFLDFLNGWIVADGSGTFKTTDGGSSWTYNVSTFAANLETVFFQDTNIGWAGGLYSIYKTTNGGLTWVLQLSPYVSSIYSLCFSLSGKGWAVGSGGKILTTYGNNPVDPDSVTSRVTGFLFEKTSSSCSTASNPNPFPGRLIKATPGPYYAVSNNSGEFTLRVPLSETVTNFTLAAVNNFNPAYQANVVCPPGNEYTISVGSTPQTISGKDFGFDITSCHHLSVEIGSDRRRRCFRNNTSLSYVNQGIIAAADSWVLVEFPHWIQPLSASHPYVVLNDSTWKFNLATIQPGQSGTIHIIDSVLCTAPLNLTQCTKATIYPAPDCPPSSNWSGAEVSVSGVCDQGVVHLGIHNTGSGDMTDSVDYTLFLDSTLVRFGKVKLASNDSLKLDVDAYGMSVTLSANQVPFHPTQSFVSTIIEACDDTTIYIPKPTVNHFPKPQVANSKTHCLPIRASYDPNDKQAFPIGFTSNHVVKLGTQMEYLVRFQNTGNDTAFTVYVIDSLDNNLNPESLELGAASHPYEISMQTTKQGRTFLRWQFNQINLPDSNENELKSHGFIQYRISPKPGITLGSQAKNEAAIYFDFNPPVFTNRTLTTFDNLVFSNPGLSDSVHVVVPTATQKSLKQLGLEVYPNPFHHTLHLKSALQTEVTVSLCDLMGKKLKTVQFRSSAELPLTELPAGVYYLKFPELNRVMKVVKE